MVSVKKSDTANFTKNFVKALAITTLATQNANAAATSPAATTDLLPGMRHRLDTTRALPSHLVPGRANISDFIDALNGAVVTHPEAAGGLGAVRQGDALLAPAPGGRKLLGANLLSATVTGCARTSYSAATTVGGQTQYVMLDSGSSSFAVIAQQCGDTCGDVGTYVPGRTATITSTPLTAYYGLGDWTGTLVKDSVTLVGGPAAQVAFGAITGQDAWVHANTCVYNETPPPNTQGIMGLADDSQLVTGTTSYFQTVKNSLYYPGYTLAPCDTGGMFFLGGYPTNFLDGGLVTTPMMPNASWTSVAMTGLAIGKTDLGITYSDLGPTVVDTGTTLMFLPEAVYQKAVNAISSQTNGRLNRAYFDNNACIPYDGTMSLPTMTFDFLDPNHPDLSQVQTLWRPGVLSYAQVEADARGNKYLCAMMGATANSQSPTILGATAMRSAMTFFDFKQNAVSFGITKDIC